MNELAIEATSLGKRFGATTALEGVDLRVRRGSVLGLLGHNGAGKTTLVNLLTTLARPSSGTASVAGFDVVRSAPEVRRRIGLTGQFATVDEQISGRDNLVLVGRLLGADRRTAQARADRLLDLFELAQSGARPARAYSGGMRRRLDLAASLVGQPEVVFLDEPTTGLDPHGRHAMWRIVGELVEDGATVVLTTQYLDEADLLADAIVVLAEGRIVASGTPAALKERIARRDLTVRLANAADVAVATEMMSRRGLRSTVDRTGNTVTVPIETTAVAPALAEVAGELERAGLEIRALTYAEPSLDAVYSAVMAGMETRAEDAVGVPSDRSLA